MEYIVTSAEADKLLRKVNEELNLLKENENQSSLFNAALGEEVEDVRPAYDYADTQAKIAACNEKVRIIKHAINQFNVATLVGDTGYTIDQMLIVLPQLAERRSKLYRMQGHLPKQRTTVRGIGNNAVIDYEYANYDVEAVKADYEAIGELISKYQVALDVVNTTKTFTIELP